MTSEMIKEKLRGDAQYTLEQEEAARLSEFPPVNPDHPDWRECECGAEKDLDYVLEDEARAFEFKSKEESFWLCPKCFNFTRDGIKFEFDEFDEFGKLSDSHSSMAKPTPDSRVIITHLADGSHYIIVSIDATDHNDKVLISADYPSTRDHLPFFEEVIWDMFQAAKKIAQEVKGLNSTNESHLWICSRLSRR